MFKFLKDKLKDTVEKFSKKVEEEAEEVEEEKVEEKTEEVKEEKEIKEEVEIKEEPKEEEKEKQGIFKKIKEKITSQKINEGKFNELFNDFEMTLLENNVALDVVDKIKRDLKVEVVDVPIKRGEVEGVILESFKESLEEVLSFEELDLIKKVKEKEGPYVIAFVGVNGSGKTTTIAKLASLFQKNNLKPVLVAADTFRSAAIQQLEEHGDKLGVKVIKHDYGSDPAAVAFDGIKHAEAKNLDVVLIDTAGRQHSNQNLIDEMKKIMRIAKPDMKIFVGESIVGNDAINQAKQFDEAIDLDGIILTKVDVDEKGGTALSISYVLDKKPIIYLCNGQDYEDLIKFDKDKILSSLEIE